MTIGADRVTRKNNRRVLAASIRQQATALETAIAQWQTGQISAREFCDFQRGHIGRLRAIAEDVRPSE